MSAFHTMMIAADPALARLAAGAGVDEIMVDLEVMGKADRQGHYDSWKSGSGPGDISAVRAVLEPGRLLVRLNPLHDGSGAEVEDALARGADALMQPMFRSWEEVARFADLVRGRARLVPLVETAAGLADLDAILRQVGPDRIHIGLNDLSLDLGLGFMFQPLADGLIDAPAASLRAAGTPFGIGGIARLGQGTVPAELILGEHVRLGSTWTILSRGFRGGLDDGAAVAREMNFAAELAALHSCHEGFSAGSPRALAENASRFRAAVSRVLAASEA